MTGGSLILYSELMLGSGSHRDTLFISKATPGDDAFVLWLAPRLEAAGYKIFADILDLQGGDRWRTKITNVLRNEAARMLLCRSDRTLARPGVLEEIEIAFDLTRELLDPTDDTTVTRYYEDDDL